MKKYIVRFLLVLLLSSFIPVISYADNQDMIKGCAANGVDYAGAVNFAQALQGALKKNDAKAIAELASYPLKINKHDKKGRRVVVTVFNKKNLAALYNDIFTAKLKEEILKADPKDIFCNYQGGMIANGAVWFAGSPKPKFFALNP